MGVGARPKAAPAPRLEATTEPRPTTSRLDRQRLVVLLIRDYLKYPDYCLCPRRGALLAENEHAALTLRDYLTTLRRWVWVILLVAMFLLSEPALFSRYGWVSAALTLALRAIQVRRRREEAVVRLPLVAVASR
jgi:hypothetical protein